MSYEQLIDTLDAITWYNGIYEPLLALKEDLLNCSDKGTYTKYKSENLEYKHKLFYDTQFEVFWMMLVLMFGDYGTSPRSGWIYLEKKQEIIDFIDKITKTGNEDEVDKENI